MYPRKSCKSLSPGSAISLNFKHLEPVIQKLDSAIHLVPVVQKMDSAIHQARVARSMVSANQR